jgi:hypothetical protein
MYLALGNLPMSGGTVSAPTGTSNQFSSRSLASEQDTLSIGEIVTQTALPVNPIFDWSLTNPLNTTATNPGFGDVRAMTSAELSAIGTTNTAAQTQFASDVTYLKSAYTTINGYINTPSTAPTTIAALETQLFPFLIRLLRVLNVVVGDAAQGVRPQ